MLSFEIYYDDLTPKAQARFNERFGEPDAFSRYIHPLAIYEKCNSKEEVDED